VSNPRLLTHRAHLDRFRFWYNFSAHQFPLACRNRVVSAIKWLVK
jgi:hypothetical protein